MTDQALSRLESQIGRLLRIGVAMSASALAAGLILCALARDLFLGGLVLLMAIPLARILTSFVDALRRGDRLLSWATGIVLLVMAMTVVYSLMSDPGSKP